MTKEQYDFVTKMLEDKKLSVAQRERVLRLVGRDLKDGVGDFEKPIRAIEEKVGGEGKGNSNSEKEQVKKSENGKSRKNQKYIDPVNLYKFLFEYNQNRILSTTCHDVDSNNLEQIIESCETKSYDFKKHLNKIKAEYRELDRKYRDLLPDYITPLISAYLTGTSKEWSSDNIKVNWSSEEVLKWCNENPTLAPNSSQHILTEKKILGIKLDRIPSKITGKTIRNFGQLVMHFKSLLHIRYDNSLYDILCRINKEPQWKDIKFEINEETIPKNIEIFTDVDKLIQAYRNVLRIIKANHSDSSSLNVKLTFTGDEKKCEFSINHLQNVYKKSKSDTIARPFGNEYGFLINLINGRSNLYLEADFGNKDYARINLWNGKKRELEPLEKSPGGVIHILEFPKK